jgi:hypothetical protein
MKSVTHRFSNWYVSVRFSYHLSCLQCVLNAPLIVLDLIIQYNLARNLHIIQFSPVSPYLIPGRRPVYQILNSAATQLEEEILNNFHGEFPHLVNCHPHIVQYMELPSTTLYLPSLSSKRLCPLQILILLGQVCLCTLISQSDQRWHCICSGSVATNMHSEVPTSLSSRT